MLIERIEKLINLEALQEDFRKIGVNFITAGIVGVFINHYVGTTLSIMFWSSAWVTCTGVFFSILGLLKYEVNYR